MSPEDNGPASFGEIRSLRVVYPRSLNFCYVSPTQLQAKTKIFDFRIRTPMKPLIEPTI